MAVLGSNFIRRTTGTGFFPAIDIKNSNGTRSGALCRAHITFNYTNLVATGVNDTSFNVNILENLSIGLIKVIFTNSMPDVDYTVIMNAQNSRVIGNGNRIFFHLRDKQLGYVILETVGGAGQNGVFVIEDADLIVFTES